MYICAYAQFCVYAIMHMYIHIYIYIYICTHFMCVTYMYSIEMHLPPRCLPNSRPSRRHRTPRCGSARPALVPAVPERRQFSLSKLVQPKACFEKGFENPHEEDFSRWCPKIDGVSRNLTILTLSVILSIRLLWFNLTNLN